MSLKWLCMFFFFLQNDDPILCDFGLFAVSGQKFEGESDGTPLYHDDSSGMS